MRLSKFEQSFDQELIKRYASAGKKKIAVSGSTGLVGAAFVEFASAAGHEVLRLSRRQPTPSHTDIHWNPQERSIDQEKLSGIDALVHLAGENIAGGRWTPELKARIRNSRIQGTTHLATELASIAHPGLTFVSASAIGFYGERGANPVDEDAQVGQGFLPTLCQEWEAATSSAKNAGVRVVIPRIGIVLSPIGGALQRMLPIFRLGLGGPLGSGSQFMSWIMLEDLVRLLYTLVMDPLAQGVYNAVAPAPVTNEDFSKTLAKVLHRPCFARVPKSVLRLMLGEFADEALLVSSNVGSKRIPELGFWFKYPELRRGLDSLNL